RSVHHRDRAPGPVRQSRIHAFTVRRIAELDAAKSAPGADFGAPDRRSGGRIQSVEPTALLARADQPFAAGPLEAERDRPTIKIRTGLGAADDKHVRRRSLMGPYRFAGVQSQRDYGVGEFGRLARVLIAGRGVKPIDRWIDRDRGPDRAARRAELGAPAV